MRTAWEERWCCSYLLSKESSRLPRSASFSCPSTQNHSDRSTATTSLYQGVILIFHFILFGMRQQLILKIILTLSFSLGGGRSLLVGISIEEVFQIRQKFLQMRLVQRAAFWTMLVKNPQNSSVSAWLHPLTLLWVRVSVKSFWRSLFISGHKDLFHPQSLCKPPLCNRTLLTAGLHNPVGIVSDTGQHYKGNCHHPRTLHTVCGFWSHQSLPETSRDQYEQAEELYWTHKPDSCSQFGFSLVTSFVVTTLHSGAETQWTKHGISKLVF